MHPQTLLQTFHAITPENELESKIKQDLQQFFETPDSNGPGDYHISHIECTYYISPEYAEAHDIDLEDYDVKPSEFTYEAGLAFLKKYNLMP